MAEELQPKGSAGEDPLGSRRSRHMAASGAGLAADRELAEMPRMVSQTPMSAYVSSVARVAGPILAVALAAGCQAAPPSPSPMGAQPPLSISNGTTIAVTLVVNGKVVEMVGPGDRDDPISAALPARPWTIETRSPAGRVLSSLTVGATDYIDRTTGRGARVDLSCGRLDVWSGPRMLGPVFSPGPTGDCD